jgi:hypothetical protein
MTSRTPLKWIPLAALGALLHCASQPLQAPQDALSRYDVVVAGLVATYDRDSGTVDLTWQPPARQPDFYKLYRTSTVGRDTLPIDFTSFGSGSRIAGNRTSFTDVVGLPNTVYYYRMRALMVASISCNGSFCDTVFVEGPVSAWDTCRAGSTVSFSIAGGDLFTAKDTLRLWLLDIFHQVVRVRFGDSAIGTTLVTNTTRNPDLTYTVDASDTIHTYPWRLKQGAGDKTVYAQLTRHTNHNGRDTIIDTIVSDGIGIRPYRADIKLRNEMTVVGDSTPGSRNPNETMRVWFSNKGLGENVGGKRDVYTIYRPFVDFNLSIFSDTTFDTAFDCRITFADSLPKLDAGPLSYTMPKQNGLTGRGAAHDDAHIYHYAFGPYGTDATWTANMARLTDVSGAGQYSAGPAQVCYDRLKAMNAGNIRGAGKKEIAVVLRMRGRYFGEERLIYSSARLNPNSRYVSYYDAYPPLVERDSWEFYYPDDGATIKGAFSVNMNQANTIFDSVGAQMTQRGLVWDKGGADVAAISLFFAEMPDSMAASWSPSSTPASITMARLLSMRHHELPFPVSGRDSKVFPVYWNIDPSGWNTGWYLVAIVTEDNFGNQGIAPYIKGDGTGAGSFYNPQHWQLITGTMGF